MPNAAQNLKALALQAQAASAQANQVKYGELIKRMTTLLTDAAKRGEEKFSLPESDPDFHDWTSAVGINYLTSPGRMLDAQVVTYADKKVLEISWSNPKPDPT